jgi:hypothetical protein
MISMWRNVFFHFQFFFFVTMQEITCAIDIDPIINEAIIIAPIIALIMNNTNV